MTITATVQELHGDTYRGNFAVTAVSLRYSGERVSTFTVVDDNLGKLFDIDNHDKTSRTTVIRTTSAILPLEFHNVKNNFF